MGNLCEQCNQTFRQKHQLRFHINVEHNKVEMFKCDSCDAQYFREAFLRQHKRAEHEGLTYKCEICDINYRIQRTFFAHMSKVHKDVDYKCEFCGMSFNAYRNLYTHIKSKHKDS